MAERRGPSRRKDSTQMWEESERSRPARDARDSRESRAPRDSREDRERDDRRRSYRSRSRERERERGGRGSSRHRGEGRDRERDRALGSGRGGGHRDADRSTAPGPRGGSSGKHRDDGRVRERRRSISRGPRRSRSPRLTRDHSGRNGRDRPVKDMAGFNDDNEIRRTTEPHTPAPILDPNRMELEQTVPSRSAGSSRQGSTAAAGVLSQPELLKTTNTVENKYDDDIEVEVDDMAAMQAMMGFGGFGSTQNKKVAGNDVSAVRKEKKTEYRQYMNRVGGFNRPLSPTRD